MFKTKQEIIIIQAEAVKPIDTNVVFWSHDKGTAKLLFQLEKGTVSQTLAEGTIVPICLDFVGGRHIYHAIIEDAINGIVSIVLEDNILGYQGQVDGSIYIELPDKRSLDTAGRFSFEIKRSPIDEDVPELEDYYWQGFAEIMNQYHQTITEIETESERLLNELQARILTLEEKLDNVELRARFKTAWSWSADGTDRFTTVYPGENLITGGWEINGLIWDTGTEVNATNRKRTGFFEVGANTQYVFSRDGSGVSVSVFEYDENKVFIGTGGESSSGKNKIVTKTETKFLRLIMVNNVDPTELIKCEKGDTPTIYTTAPSDDPINAYPTYKGISIVDSDNPADYSWQAEDNTIAKKVTLDSHTENISNPHKVTKTQIGLGNVDNYSTATQAEAEAGTATNKFITPALVFKAIAKWVQGKFVSSTGNETILGTKNFQDGLQTGGLGVQAGMIERAITDADRSDKTNVTDVNGKIIRIGNIVFLTFNFKCGTWPEGSETRWILKIPDGFKRDQGYPPLTALSLVRNASQLADARAFIDQSSIIQAKSGSGSSYISGMWITQDPWPA